MKERETYRRRGRVVRHPSSQWENSSWGTLNPLNEPTQGNPD